MIRRLIVLASLGVPATPALAQPTMVETIEIRRTLGTGEVIDFVFADAMGGVTQQSVGDPDGDGIISINVPPTAFTKHVHLPSCLQLAGTNVVAPDSGRHRGMVPLLRDLSTGLSLMPSMPVDDVDQVPALSVGQVITVVSGASPAYPVATIRAPGLPWDAIPPELFGDPSAFPLFTGTAEVADLLDTTVIIRCAADVDADGSVGVPDLLDLLGAWGPCPAPCPPDTNGDGDVGVPDLLNLLGTWGACP